MMVEHETDSSVLDGAWVCGLEALDMVEHSIRVSGHYVADSVGNAIAKLAADGLVPAISPYIARTMPIPVASAKPDLEAEAAPSTPRWSFVGRGRWLAFQGISARDGVRVHMTQQHWDASTFQVIYTKQKLDLNAPVVDILNDPGFHLTHWENTLFYREPLLYAARLLSGVVESYDRYSLTQDTLAALCLPQSLPTDTWRGKLKPAVASVNAAVDPPFDAPADTKAGTRAGGRNAGPIAALTIKLMRVSRVELERYTGAAVAAELAEIYLTQGTSRAEETLRKEAAAILREVRSAQNAPVA